MNAHIKTALIQTPLTWEDPEANRKVLQKKIEELEEDTNLAVLPEMFTSGFTMHPERVAENMEGKTLTWIREVAMASDVAITGSVVITENGKCYNRLLFAHPDGKVEYYDKRHTFTLAGEDKVYDTGKKRLIVEYKGWKLCPMICYDLRFPVWARNTEAYDALLFVANWPLPRISAWDTLLRARAVENLCYCLGVNRVGQDQNGHKYPGHSAVYGVLGEEIAFSDREEIIYATLEREKITHYRNKLRFLEDRDRFTIS
ncbi:amidohydrolase [Sinomicrobium weinanense]|uniref:Omega-amidase YafV n=1 Tax=Sinomicrobium weinanense TaxID=2842200 RepID=A0A926JQ78_9FLAO|nr:amidohydrolase [Sinomicrobium weinanense]MBC9795467.1 amidohydrolase [Sinomicrobium weinanense]MBU3123992.1 amidohydrolase [Sinomicrobium weinanense]